MWDTRLAYSIHNPYVFHTCSGRVSYIGTYSSIHIQNAPRARMHVRCICHTCVAQITSSRNTSAGQVSRPPVLVLLVQDCMLCLFFEVLELDQEQSKWSSIMKHYASKVNLSNICVFIIVIMLMYMTLYMYAHTLFNLFRSVQRRVMWSITRAGCCWATYVCL